MLALCPSFCWRRHTSAREDGRSPASRRDLLDRRLEITGLVGRKMIIDALNSGASIFMADFEDSNFPTWMNNLEGQANLRDAIEGTIRCISPDGKR
jgi:malate synthase